MSMKLFMILKFIQILCVYIGMTTVLPFFVLRTTLLRQRLTEKILICFLVGNFYIMNLVFLLQLLHISNQFTLIIGTFVPAFIAWVRINHIDLPEKICQAHAALLAADHGTQIGEIDVPSPNCAHAIHSPDENARPLHLM